VPVVTTRSNGVSEILHDGADVFIIGASDPGALADRLGKLVGAAGLRERPAVNGCEAVKAFTWERTAKETMAVYKTVRSVKGSA